MPTATLTSKGQITIPLAVRTALGLHAGAKMDFVLDQNGFKVVTLQNACTKLKGRFAGRVSQAVSIEAMNEAIAAEAANRQDGVARSKQ